MSLLSTDQVTEWNQAATTPLCCPHHPQVLAASNVNGSAAWECPQCESLQPLLVSDIAEIPATTNADPAAMLLLQNPPLPPTNARGQLGPGTIFTGLQGRRDRMPWFLDGLDLGPNARLIKQVALLTAVMLGIYYAVIAKHIPHWPYYLGTILSWFIIAAPGCLWYAIRARRPAIIDERCEVRIGDALPGQWISARIRRPRQITDLPAYGAWALQIAQIVRVGLTNQIRITFVNGTTVMVKDTDAVCLLDLAEPGLVPYLG